MSTVQAIFDGTVIAESDQCKIVEGNTYFPPKDVSREYLQPSSTTTVCHWKGEAKYYDLVIGDKRISDAAWYYPNPSERAGHIKDYVAFYVSKGIRIKPR